MKIKSNWTNQLMSFNPKPNGLWMILCRLSFKCTIIKIQLQNPSCASINLHKLAKYQPTQKKKIHIQSTVIDSTTLPHIEGAQAIMLYIRCEATTFLAAVISIRRIRRRSNTPRTAASGKIISEWHIAFPHTHTFAGGWHRYVRKFADEGASSAPPFAYSHNICDAHLWYADSTTRTYQK